MRCCNTRIMIPVVGAPGLPPTGCSGHFMVKSRQKSNFGVVLGDSPLVTFEFCLARAQLEAPQLFKRKGRKPDHAMPHEAQKWMDQVVSIRAQSAGSSGLHEVFSTSRSTACANVIVFPVCNSGVGRSERWVGDALPRKTYK